MDGPRIARARASKDEPVTLSGMDRSGAAVASVGDERLLVPGGIPGERVRVKRLRPVGRSVLCEIVAVEEASPNRVTPRCRHASACGGCAWQHIAYPEQLRLKTEMVDRLVKRAVPKAPAALPMIAATPIEDPWHYRQKAHFVFGPPSPGGFGGPGSPASRGGGSGRAGLIMGHYARGSRRLCTTNEATR